jgi:hypothetical protein
MWRAASAPGCRTCASCPPGSSFARSCKRFGPNDHGAQPHQKTTTPDDWPFDQPRNCAAVTLRSIVFDGAPILHVTHDADDHGWQFLGREDADAARAAVVSLSEIVKVDPSVLAVADVPPGWHAWRHSKGSPWQRSPIAPDPIVPL